MNTYWIDTDMMGGDFCGTTSELSEFADMLRDRLDAAGLDVEIEVITDTTNGAHNENIYLVPEYIWMDALNATPPEWWTC